jgi:hypothetical protein
MRKELKHETFRAGTDSFDREFADFLVSMRQDNWSVKKCTFFHDGNRMKSWAFCAFEH